MHLSIVLRNRLYYYFVKPYFPVAFRRSVRRLFAIRKLAQSRHLWPILPGSEKPPEQWSGWPDGKSFAFVLTHDVEGRLGVNRCRQLMELEAKLGFRSSFNFVPEGEYRVSSELLQSLRQNGFEVGVHDLHHDGKLYNNRRDFRKKAARINQHLCKMGAVGFRSGFMLRQLEWIHNLDIQYDASTFDTDPFEPQPDGAGTIFPFWVPNSQPLSNASRDGYVELPYTLPQDSTLFLFLGERNINVWKRKLDWIAEHGGMALVNVHPDYLRFDGDGDSSATFPAEHYIELLEYVQKKYHGRFWHALPKEVASFARSVLVEEFQSRPATPMVEGRSLLPLKPSDAFEPRIYEEQTGEGTAKMALDPEGVKPGKAVLMIAYTEYISDGRVIRAAEAALSGGFVVDVMGLRRLGSEDLSEHRGVRLVNVSQSRYRGGGIFSYSLSYLEFFIRCFFKTTLLFLKRKYAIVHVNNMPDFFVFCTLLPKLMGAKVFLDIHDPMAETFASKFKSGRRSFFYKMLLWEERLSAWFADCVITVHEPVKEHILVKHGLRPESIVVIANFADENIFRVQKDTVPEGKLRMVFHGTVLERYGFSNLMLALAKTRNKDRISVKIIGDGDFSGRLKELIAELSLGDMVEFDNRVYPWLQIPPLLVDCNLGLVPIEISEITEFILPLKLLEYISMGIPPVTVRNTAIGHYFKEGDCFFYKPGEPESLAALLDFIAEHPEVLLEHREKALALRPKFVWGGQKEKYIQLLRQYS